MAAGLALPLDGGGLGGGEVSGYDPHFIDITPPQPLPITGSHESNTFVGALWGEGLV